jgi:transposase InsO family protein
MRKRKRSSTRRDPGATPAPDLVNRDCKTDAPDRLWVADITAYRAREEAELDLVRWIDGWYNPRRIQRELGWLSPDEYEEAYYRRQSCGTQASPAGAR